MWTEIEGLKIVWYEVHIYTDINTWHVQGFHFTRDHGCFVLSISPAVKSSRTLLHSLAARYTWSWVVAPSPTMKVNMMHDAAAAHDKTAASSCRFFSPPTVRSIWGSLIRWNYCMILRWIHECFTYRAGATPYWYQVYTSLYIRGLQNASFFTCTSNSYKRWLSRPFIRTARKT